MRPAIEYHFGRSFTGTDLEDRCPCDKAPCGLVKTNGVKPYCKEHPLGRMKTMRQNHRAQQCPAEQEKKS